MVLFANHLPLFFLFSAYSSAASLDCDHIRAGDQSFNLRRIGGPKTVHDVRWESPSIQNTTFTIDLCAPLKDSEAKKGDKCPAGTRVCGKEWNIRDGVDPFLTKVIPIAGEFTASHGRSRALAPKFTRLKASAGNTEEKEGLLIELHGGKHPDDRSGVPQKAIVELLCDQDWTGNEGFEQDAKTLDGGSYRSMGSATDDDDDDDDAPELPDLDKGKALQFIRYTMGADEKVKVLRLQWKTKYACEGAADSGDGDNGASDSGSWGFFTWLLIIVFLSAAAYIIFGSWLNYNRYGARGWDLIPHGDAIRDMPYVAKEWAANMGDRLRGDNSRGGYSAV